MIFFQGDKNAHDEFVELNYIYEVLMDDDLRSKYDIYGEEGIKANSQHGGGYQSWQFYNEVFGIYDDDLEITTLSRNDFDQVTSNSNEIWFVNFYSTYCSFCHQLAPTWREFARKMFGGIRIGAVNCADDPFLCQSQGINGYPSLVLFPKRIYYNGIRSVDALVKFVIEYMDVDLYDLNEENFKNLLDEHSNSLLGWLICFHDEEGECISEINQYKLARLLHGIVLVLKADCLDSATKNICDDLGRSEGLIFYPAKNVDKQHETIIDTRDTQEIMEIILKFIPELTVLDFQDLKQLIEAKERNSPILIGFVSGKIKSEFKQLSSRLSSNIQLFLADCLTVPTICEDLEIHEFPRWIMFKKSGYEIYYDKTDSIHDIVYFAQESSNSPLITLTVDKYYEAISSSKMWLIDYFTPWCPPCLRFLHELRKLDYDIAKKLDIEIGALDCVKHFKLCQSSQINNYPTTTVYFSNTTNTKVGYHTADDIVDFIEDIRNPSVHELNPSSFEHLVVNRDFGSIWMVDFFAPWCQPCQQLAPEFRKLARNLLAVRNDISFASINCQIYGRFCFDKFIQHYPTLHLYQQFSNKNPEIYPFYWTDHYSMESWLNYTLKSKVRKNMGEEFFETVLTSSESWLILFKGLQCSGHGSICSEFRAVFDAVADILDGRVKLAEINCWESGYICETLGLNSSYFSIYLYPGTNNTRQDMKGIFIEGNSVAEKIVADVIAKLEADLHKSPDYFHNLTKAEL